jgi:alpha-amylase
MRYSTAMSSRSPRLATIVAALFVAACAATTSPSPAGPTDPTISASPPSSGPAACVAPSAGASTAGWWRERVFYEVFVRSFADSDGDGIGDLRGLTERLDDLNDGDPDTTDDLGVTGLWLMPIAESPSYHGYDVVDYRAVEQDYGSMTDLAALVDAAHERGIAIIVDLVINHTSREHPWFQDARSPGSDHDDWYLWADEHPAIARSDGSRVWHPDGERFYYGYFWEGMPDLNLGNPEVTAELDSIADFWLDAGIDGFRIDAARHLFEDGRKLENVDSTFVWLESFRDRIKQQHPDALILGEVWDAPSMSARYVREGALDVTFDFSLASAVVNSIRSGDGGAVRSALDEVAQLYEPGWLATFLTNHDQDRVMTVFGGDVESAKLAATLLLTGGGTPFLYYGEEIGLTGQKPDERIRTPMRWDASGPAAGFTTGTPWEPLGEDPPGTDVATQRADQDSLYSTYRDLLALRAGEPALRSGTLWPVRATEPSVVAYLRAAPDSTGGAVLVVANLAEAPARSFALTADEGPVCGAPTTEVLRGPDGVVPPSVGASGGFADYVPLADGLGAREVLIVRFRP